MSQLRYITSFRPSGNSSGDTEAMAQNQLGASSDVDQSLLQEEQTARLANNAPMSEPALTLPQWHHHRTSALDEVVTDSAELEELQALWISFEWSTSITLIILLPTYYWTLTFYIDDPISLRRTVIMGFATLAAFYFCVLLYLFCEASESGKHRLQKLVAGMHSRRSIVVLVHMPLFLSIIAVGSFFAHMFALLYSGAISAILAIGFFVPLAGMYYSAWRLYLTQLAALSDLKSIRRAGLIH